MKASVVPRASHAWGGKRTGARFAGGAAAVLLLVSAALAGAHSAAQSSSESVDAFAVERIQIITRDVYGVDEASRRPLYRFFNGVHVTSKAALIERELWFAPGDRIGAAQLAEVERNLRGLGLFASVEARAETGSDPGSCVVVITTRDRLSILASASGAFVGGVSGFQTTLGETNLFGYGDQLVGTLRTNSEGERNGTVRYRDRHVFGSWLQLDVSGGTTEEGNRFGVALTRPTKHLEDSHSYRVSAGFNESETDYFEAGASVAEVPQTRLSAGARGSRTFGPRDRRSELGFALDARDTEFGAARGPQAASIDVPGDLRVFSFGPFWRYSRIRSFEKLQRIDAIDFIEDVQLGTSYAVALAGQWRREVGEATRLEPSVSASVRGADRVAPATYLTYELSGGARLRGDDARGWSVGGALHGFQQSLPHQTLAASVTYDQVFEGDALPIEVTLGEDNGLRGYPARQFAGTERVRINLEDRIDVGLELRSLHFAPVVFFDAGWIGDDGLEGGFSSVGIGLRIGSKELLGRGVLRLDLAFPLRDAPGEDLGPSLSFALGQVFGFFGNGAELSTR